LSSIGLAGNWSSAKTFTTLSGNNAVLCLPPTGVKSSMVSTQSATISWLNATGTQGIDLQYRLNNTAWQTISLPSTQSYTLNNLIPSRTYTYRLRAKCNTNNYSVYTATYNFSTLAAKEENLFSGKQDIVLYPNPGDGLFTLFNRTTNLPVAIIVYDFSGRAVFSATIESGVEQYTIDLSDRSTGVYLLKCYTGNTVKYVKIFKHN